MVLALLIVLGLSIVCPILGAIIGIIGQIKNGSSGGSSYHPTDYQHNRRMGFNDHSRSSFHNDSRSYSNPFDNHWESSFDWKDDNNDGYDDRDDGFWNEREF